MKIKFGTTAKNEGRVALLVGVLFSIFLCGHFPIQYILDDAHEALRQALYSNVTSIKMQSLCGLPYDNCRCSIQSIKDIDLKPCLTDTFLLGSRIFPLLSFILQVCLARDLFTLSGNYTRYVIYGLWATAGLIFITIARGIYQTSCSHRIINVVVFEGAGILFMLEFHNLTRNQHIHHSSLYNHYTPDDNSITHNQISEEIITDYQSSDEITNNETSEEITDESVFLLDLL